MRQAVGPIPIHLRSANSAESKQNSQFPEGPGKVRKDVLAQKEEEEKGQFSHDWTRAPFSRMENLKKIVLWAF
jgi:hypothetical protein